MRVGFELGVIRVDQGHPVAACVAHTHPAGDERRMNVHQGEAFDDAVEIAPADSGSVKR